MYLLLQSGETRQWFQLVEEPNITYDKDDLQFEPKLIASDTIDVKPHLNRLIQSMERDLKTFSTEFKKHINETVHCAWRSIQMP